VRVRNFGTSSTLFQHPIRTDVGVLGLLARRFGAATIVAAAALVFAPAALADTTNSTNWAGYAVHGTNVTFRTVSGSWREPSATCTPGQTTYSSYWVGIGGYSLTSPALEQIGTELDCTASGQARSSAWYELVPAAAVQLQLTVHPGDMMSASVTVNGKKVTLSLDDLTRKQAFTKTLTASRIDDTSAEWIVEAPSECVTQNVCQTLPLANFGTAAFTGASVTSGTGRTGGLDDPGWQTTKIKLVPQTSHHFFAGNGGAPLTIGSASPSSVGAGDHSFTVSYSATTTPSSGTSFARISSAAVRPASAMRPAS
jgi:Peptidase A4 family